MLTSKKLRETMMNVGNTANGERERERESHFSIIRLSKRRRQNLVDQWVTDYPSAAPTPFALSMTKADDTSISKFVDETDFIYARQTSKS